MVTNHNSSAGHLHYSHPADALPQRAGKHAGASSSSPSVAVFDPVECPCIQVPLIRFFSISLLPQVWGALAGQELRSAIIGGLLVFGLVYLKTFGAFPLI